MSESFPLIIADESVDARIIQHLTDKGFAVYSIINESPGISDTRVIEIAIEKNGYIITEDKDFGDQLVYRKVHNVGSMLLRINDMALSAKTRLVFETIQYHGSDLKGCFSVLTSKKLRIRKYD